MVLSTNQQEAGVHETKCPRASDAGAAVHHHWSLVRIQTARLSHLEQEVQEGGRRLWDPKVRPGGVVKM